LEMLHQEISLLVLPERRPRHYAREVKIKMSAYRKKTPPNRGSLSRWPEKRLTQAANERICAYLCLQCIDR
jgi:hypothetical protein